MISVSVTKCAVRMHWEYYKTLSARCPVRVFPTYLFWSPCNLGCGERILFLYPKYCGREKTFPIATLKDDG